MADDKEELKEVVSDIEIPTEFSMIEQMEEITTTYRERSDFLETKLQAGKISTAAANLARIRIARLAALGRTFRAMVEGGAEPVAKVEPKIEQTPVTVEPPAVDEPKEAAPVDDGWDD